MGKKNNYDDWFVFSDEIQSFHAGICPYPAKQKRDDSPKHSSTPYQIRMTMELSCRQCGQCCSSMGEIIRIIEQTGRFEYRIEYIPTGIRQLVWIDPDKRVLYSHALHFDQYSLSCPFLRILDDHRVICIIHQTRPELCRKYFCDRQKRREHHRMEPVTSPPE